MQQKGKISRMKSEKLQTPEIQLDMKTVYEIYHNGRRITRSSISPAPNRTSSNQTGEKTKQLLRYLGDPCLNNYFLGSNIKYTQFLSQDYLPNKKMRRIGKQHLPQNCIFYQKNILNQQITYRLRTVKLMPRKSKTNQYFIEQANRPNNFFSKSINIQDDIGILTASQSLILYFISFEDFKKFFKSVLIDIKNIFKTHKLEELSKIVQNQLMINEDENQNQQQMKDQQEQNQAINENAEQKDRQNRKQLQAQVMLTSINKQIAQLDYQIFKKLCFGNLTGILWPCIVLQPLVSQKDELDFMINKNLDNVSKEEYRNNKTQIKLDEKILFLAYEQFLLEEAMQNNKQTQIRQKQQINAITESVNKKVMNRMQSFQRIQQSNIHIFMLCTNQSKIISSSFIKWEQFQYEQISKIISNTPFRLMSEELNTYIQSFNKFKRHEQHMIDNKNSLYRLSKYENDSGQIIICIPLRIEQSKDQKSVLVRLMKPQHHDFISNQPQILKWIDINRLKVNFTLPRHNEIEKKFYYLLGNNIGIEQGINYIYSDFYYKVCSFSQVLRICYPLNQLRRIKTKQQRCIQCYYQMHSLPFYRCKFCLNFCHQECTTTKKRVNSDSQTTNIAIISNIPTDIHQTDNDDQLWHCIECSPCTQCHMAVNKNYLKCLSCKSLFHPICGKIKGFSDLGAFDDKYTCQNCLKCLFCGVKLKNQEYCIEGKDIFCLKCYKDYKNDEYCIVCMKQIPGKVEWVQCDQLSCNKWVHCLCDQLFKHKENKQNLQQSNYSCPNCRLKERRKLLHNIIEQLKYFDEYQYFYEPDYEEIIGYKQAIKNSICIIQMRERAIDGFYDKKSFQNIKADLQLVVKNAMTFNMPKDEAHYRAKILLVVGTKFLEAFKELIECNEEYLINNNINQIFFRKKTQFYNKLYTHYLQYLLNFGSERGVVQIKKATAFHGNQDLFSSKFLISRCFSNCQFSFKIKKKPHKIQNLFHIPRLANASWCSIRTKVCFYHPNQRNPIVYECPICFQPYCCTKICYNHRICTICGIKGCGCDNYLCRCPVMREKERKNYESRLNSALGHLKIQKKEYTEYFKYCLKCVQQNLKTNNCYICRKFCYYAYEKCLQCGLVYHLSCEKKNKLDEFALFFDNEDAYSRSYQNIRLNNLCFNCSYSHKYYQVLKQRFQSQIKAKAFKISTIGKYLPIFSYIYENNGIRLTPNEIITTIYQNYQQFISKEMYFSEILLNFAVLIQSMGNNRIAREQFRQYFTNEIYKKLSNHQQHEKYISFVETKEMKQLKQSKKYYKIYSKWFNNLYHPLNFLNTYQIRYHLQHLMSKMNISSNNILNSPLNPYQIHDHNIIATNFKEQNHFNYKSFERIKIQAITAHVSPKSKRNIYTTTKLQKYKIYLNYLTFYQHYKKFLKFQVKKPDFSEDLSKTKIIKEYESYLKYFSERQNLQECIYRDENSRILLCESLNHDHFNPFNENSTIIKYNKLSIYRQQESIYLNNRSQMLFKYVSNFALKIYQENKVVLKKGCTSILNQSKNSWRVLKKMKGNNVDIKLEKRQQNWILSIGQQNVIVKSIDDMIKLLKQLSPTVNSFENIAQFMGFDMQDCTFYEPNHFTVLMQTKPLDSLNRLQRKKLVLFEYNRYEWKRQGNFTISMKKEGKKQNYEYNVTKKQLFFLKKRNHKQQSQQDSFEPKVIPFITFEDIKKDLDENTYGVIPKQKELLIYKQPTYDVYIAPSKIDRLGLFIRNNTKKNTIVVQYIGEVISEAIADIRQQKFRNFGCYMFALSKNVSNNSRAQIIDATFTGNMARYLNHSCDPNCKAKIENLNGKPRIFIYTIKDIRQNDQLTYDYQFKIDTNERLVCKCKSKNCQGRLT